MQISFQRLHAGVNNIFKQIIHFLKYFIETTKRRKHKHRQENLFQTRTLQTKKPLQIQWLEGAFKF